MVGHINEEDEPRCYYINFRAIILLDEIYFENAIYS
jgi:hypothetical protein